MRLKINHTTEYLYEEVVPYSLQRLRLTPLSGPMQTVLNWDVAVEGATVETRYDDHFGNRIELVESEGPSRAVKVTASGKWKRRTRQASSARISATRRFGFSCAIRR